MLSFLRAITVMGLLLFLFGCGGKESPFQQKDGAWYYNSVLIEGSDVRSFQVLSEHYAKDKSRVYYGDTYREGRDYFTTKRSRVKIIEGADAGSFRYIDRDYARGQKSWFFEGVQFPVKDADTFELLDYGHARDRISGYYHQRPIPGSEGKTFSAIDTHYSKDANHVFYSDLEPHAGEPLRRMEQIKNAQPGTFRVLDGGYASDAAQVYFQGNLLTKDVASFSMLQRGYAKTRGQVYYSGKPVTGADPLTFAMLEPATDTADAKDRTGTYQLGHRAAKAQ